MIGRKYAQHQALDMLEKVDQLRGDDDLSWEELRATIALNLICDDITSDNAAEVHRTWTSKQVLKILVPGGYGYEREPATIKAIMKLLRPEDVTNIPELHIDIDTGNILDWNRSMSDLTGVGRWQVVGRKYGDVLLEHVPCLSVKYRTEALKFVLSRCIAEELTECKSGGPPRFESDDKDELDKYAFPLPLPLRQSSEEKDSIYCDFVEMIAVGSKHKPESGYFVYPPGVNYRRASDKRKEPGWFGGVVFTARRLRRGVPTLQSLCQAVVPQEYFSPDGSIAQMAAKIPSGPGEQHREGGNGALSDIVTHVRSFPCPASLSYLREVLFHLREIWRKSSIPPKIFTFSEDWSQNDETKQLNAMVVQALGGESVVQQTVRKGKLSWRFVLGSHGKDKKDGLSSCEQAMNDRERIMWIVSLNKLFLAQLCPLLAEHAPAISEATDAPCVLPAIEYPERAVLTLKIEGVEGCSGSWQEEPIKSWATIRVPATLNFFQLHRVVMQTISGGPHCNRETHEWAARNLASRSHGYTDGTFDSIQIGEVFLVEDGSRQDYGIDDSLFKKGNALRQRISHTAAHFDLKVPFFCREDHELIFGHRSLREPSVGKISACLHSTCISTLFFQPGAQAFMQDGLCKFYAKYKLTCSRIDPYDGPLPTNPDIIAFLPECLRGKSPEDSHWSANNANKQLYRDRGCLRRKFCKMNSKQSMQHMPWCYDDQIDMLGSNKLNASPLALRLRGADGQPMYLWGEPPLPGSDGYQKHISDHDERVDPKFDLRHVFGCYGTAFAVPFGSGSRRGSSGYDSCDEGAEDCEGTKWERQADEADQEMESTNTISKKRGRKRKQVEA